MNTTRVLLTETNGALEMADLESESPASQEATPRSAAILRYRREELLCLHDVCSHFQDEWWTQLLAGLEPEVLEGLRGIEGAPDAGHLRRRSTNSERRQRSKAKREALHALSTNALGYNQVSEDYIMNAEILGDGHEAEEYDSTHEVIPVSSWRTMHEKTGGRSNKGKGSWRHSEKYDDDKEVVESFQPPAFAVEGEPDFESGPPQDGWEYLRRVKYEAARCPKVVVATIDPMKLKSEQTPYMPEIPAIPACAPDLCPSKEWENDFMMDFSLLRKTLSDIHLPPTSECLPSIWNKAAWEVRCFGSVTGTPQEDSNDQDGVTIPNADGSSAESLETEHVTKAEEFETEKLFGLAELGTENVIKTEELETVNEMNVEGLETENVIKAEKWETENEINIDGLETENVIKSEEWETANAIKFDELETENVIKAEELVTGNASKVELEPENVIKGEECRRANTMKVEEFEKDSAIKAEEVETENAIKGDELETERTIKAEELDTESVTTAEEVETENEIKVDGLETDRAVRAEELETDNLIKVVELEIASTTKAEKLETENAITAVEWETENAVKAMEVEIIKLIKAELLETENARKNDDLLLLSLDSPQSRNDFLSTKNLIEEDRERDSQEGFLDYMDALDSLGPVEFTVEDLQNEVVDQFEYLTIGEPERSPDEVELMEPSFSYPEALELEDNKLTTTNFTLMDQFEYMTIGDPEGNQDEIDVMEPAFYPEELESEDKQVTTSNFMDSLVGLEVFRSENSFFNEPDEGFSVSGDTLKLDESTSEVFAKVFQNDGVPELPWMQLLLQLDEVSRAALFRYHVSWLENIDGLPQERALWLLALSAVVDTPLNGETCAAFRALLRHCAGIRATQQDRNFSDCDVHLLNALITVAGSYFGQAETTSS